MGGTKKSPHPLKRWGGTLKIASSPPSFGGNPKKNPPAAGKSRSPHDFWFPPHVAKMSPPPTIGGSTFGVPPPPTWGGTFSQVPPPHPLRIWGGGDNQLWLDTPCTAGAHIGGCYSENIERTMYRSPIPLNYSAQGWFYPPLDKEPGWEIEGF